MSMSYAPPPPPQWNIALRRRMIGVINANIDQCVLTFSANEADAIIDILIESKSVDLDKIRYACFWGRHFYPFNDLRVVNYAIFQSFVEPSNNRVESLLYISEEISDAAKPRCIIESARKHISPKNIKVFANRITRRALNDLDTSKTNPIAVDYGSSIQNLPEADVMPPFRQRSAENIINSSGVGFFPAHIKARVDRLENSYQPPRP